MFLCAKIIITFYRFSFLFELGLSKNFDDVILAYVARALQLERLTKRDGLE
jgi:dephospho-CoA kinase